MISCTLFDSSHFKLRRKQTDGLLITQKLQSQYKIYNNKDLGVAMNNQNLFYQTMENFKEIIGQQSIFQRSDRQFLLQQFRFKKISLKNTQINYSQLKKRYQKKQIEYLEDQWHKNQRKLFIQFLICYCQLKKTTPNLIESAQWEEMGRAFFKKQPNFLKFQGLSIMKNSNKLNWVQQDDQLIKKNLLLYGQGKWNQISKKIFNDSNCQKYLSPKHIRERWYNHLSQSVNRSAWSVEEDLYILEYVAYNSMKWCQIVKQFNHTRTQHMIKNRFKFLTKRSCRTKPITMRRAINLAISKVKRKIKKLSDSEKSLTTNMIKYSEKQIIAQNRQVSEKLIQQIQNKTYQSIYLNQDGLPSQLPKDLLFNQNNLNFNIDQPCEINNVYFLMPNFNNISPNLFLYQEQLIPSHSCANMIIPQFYPFSLAGHGLFQQQIINNSVNIKLPYYCNQSARR